MSAQIIQMSDFVRRRLERAHPTVADIDRELARHSESIAWIRKELAEKPMPRGSVPYRWIDDLLNKCDDLLDRRAKLLGSKSERRPLTPAERGRLGGLAKRSPVHCGYCHKPGHNIRGCSEFRRTWVKPAESEADHG